MLVLPVSQAVVSEPPRYGGTLVVNLPSDITTLDLSTYETWAVGFVASQIFDTLVVPDKEWNILPSLAWKWQVNMNEKYMQFWLNKNVTWHDGKPFTAADVKFTFDEILGKTQPNVVAFFKGTKVEVVDDYTVIVRPAEWSPGFQMMLLATSNCHIYPKHILSGQDLQKTDFHSSPVGTGPFMFKEWKKGSQVELVKNPSFWKKGKPYLDRIVVRIIPEPAAAISAYERGEIDYMFRGIPYELYGRLKSLPNTEVYATTSPTYKFRISFNLRQGRITSNVLVRRAIAYGVNVTDFVSRATNGLSKQTDSHWSTEIVPLSPSLARYRYDPAKAQELLDKAGYPKGPDGKRFSIELQYRRGEPEEGSVAEMIRDHLAKIGIEVKLKLIDFAALLQSAYSSYDFDFWLMKIVVLPTTVYNMYHKDMMLNGVTFSNSYGFTNATASSLLDALKTEPDPKKQIELMQKIDVILSQELPDYAPYDVTWVQLKRGDFRGTNIPIGDRCYVFSQSLDETYWIKGTPPVTPTTTTTTRATTTVAPAAGPDTTLVWVLAVVVIGAAVFLAMRRRKKT